MAPSISPSARTTPLQRNRRRTATALSLGLAVTLGGTFGGSLAAQAETSSAGAAALPDASQPSVLFERHDVDTNVTGASFTSVGEVYPGEKNIITAGYGTLAAGVPSGGGTLQVYRPGSSLSQWQSVTVFDSDDEIVFPNRPTVVDVDGDGLNDLLVPSGYFFDTNAANPGGAQERSAITWWRNEGLDGDGQARGFTRNDIVTGQGPSYHGVELVDLDGDGIRDIVTTAEAGVVANNQDDDVVTLQYLRGTSATTFAAPVALAEGLGGSHPTVADVNGDGRLDIVSSQYFNLSFYSVDKASFLWFERLTDGTGAVSASDFTPHTIATAGQAGFGFQIRPVPDFRTKGKISWIGTNHQGRCWVERAIPSAVPGVIRAREMVMEFVPGNDITAPWTVTELSTPGDDAALDSPCDPAFRAIDTTLTTYPTGQISSRASAGQAAPGVFGYGDFDDDGDVDLVVSGDGDRRLFWIENRPDQARSTVLHTLSAPGELFGQSGGAVVEDFDGDGTPEVVFSSFDTNTVAIWKAVPNPDAPTTPKPTPTPPVTTGPTVTPTPVPTVRTYRTTLTVKASPKRPKAGRRAAWRVTLRGAPRGKARTVKVTFRAKGSKRVTTIKRLRVAPGQGTKHTAKLVWKPRRDGTLTFRYAGSRVSSTAKEKASSRVVKVRVRR